MIFVETSVNSETAGSYIGSSNSVILHLVEGDSVDISECTDIDTFYTNLQTSFSGFLFKEEAEPRDPKTMTLGTDLSIRTSHSCQILI